MKALRTYGRPVNVEVEIYEECKYKTTEEPVTIARYEGLDHWYIITGEDATEVGNMTDEASRDDYNEYLELHFTDGSVATFRNSYVDMFRVAEYKHKEFRSNIIEFR